MEIRFSKMFAGITSTIIREWSKIFGIFCIVYFDIFDSSKCLSVPTQSCRQHTIKHIKSLFYRMTNIFWSTDSHQISWLIDWQFGCGKRNYFTNQILTFSHTHSSDRDSISRILRKKLYRLLSQIQIRSSLYDRKKNSANIIIFWLEMIKCSLGSTMSHLHMFFDSFFVCTRR